ncbi:MAG: tetratricopeptide repeat-containing protein, partial [Desulfovibrionaceae bacterium]|nr:tetratricopeptide repeat-containing protein [Desulfovibrionaceae bacterium]
AAASVRMPARARSLPPEDDFPDTEEAEFEEDEQISLKTRSMAEVLAEQGDYAGALGIYEELLREAGSAKEKAGLEEAIARLKAEISAMSPAPPSVSEENHLAGQPVLTRVLDVLEKLVGRVEERAGGISVSS